MNYKLVGDQTYGKGTAQTQKQLSDGSVLKYTYAKWLLPSGTWINGKGLTPDYSVSNTDTSGIYTKALKLIWDMIVLVQQLPQCKKC